MGKGPLVIGERDPGICIACRTPFVGPGERCPKCQQKLRARKRRKPR